MRVDTQAIVVGVRGHGEHGAIVRLMTPAHGLLHCYVRGARGRRLRPVLLPGNRIQAAIASRTDTQLAQGTIELIHSLGPMLQEPLAAALIDWAAALTASALAEAQPYPRLFDALDGLLSAVEAAPSASSWGAALVRYEMLVLAELGFGLDLSQCAVSGVEADLVAVSPRSGRAVSAEAAAPYTGSLLPLPAFLRDGDGRADWTQILDGLTLTGHFLSRDVLVDRARPAGQARSRLIDRLRRAAGIA